MDSEPRTCLLLIRLTELRRRLVIRHYFGPLNRHEIERYLQHRLRNAGTADKIRLIEDYAIEMMHSQARGLPRQINRLTLYKPSAAAQHQT